MQTPNPTVETTLIMKQVFPTSREKLFEAWTNPGELKKWFAPGDADVPFAELDLKVGGKYRIGIQDHEDNKLHVAAGTYREIRPPEKLSFTWTWEGNPDFGETLVTVEFREQGTETEMVLVHELFQTVKLRDDHKKGWSACLMKLAKAL